MLKLKSKRAVLVTAPTVEPISVEEARRQCKIDHTDEDNDLQEYIKTARQYFEAVTGTAVTQQTWDIYYNGFADRLILPKPPLLNVSSIKYQDSTNTQQTLSASIYEVGAEHGIDHVRLAYDQQWPTTLGHADDVVVRIVCGYGAAPSSVPSPIRHAVRLLVAHQYSSRAPLVIGAITEELPFSLASMLELYKAEGT